MRSVLLSTCPCNTMTSWTPLAIGWTWNVVRVLTQQGWGAGLGGKIKKEKKLLIVSNLI